MAHTSRHRQPLTKVVRKQERLTAQTGCIVLEPCHERFFALFDAHIVGVEVKLTFRSCHFLQMLRHISTCTFIRGETSVLAVRGHILHRLQIDPWLDFLCAMSRRFVSQGV